MKNRYKHLFFDLDKTLAPSRQQIRDHMFELVSSLPHDIVIVTGQAVEVVAWQSSGLRAYKMGQNGNHALDIDDAELWKIPLEANHKLEIHSHIQKLLELIDDAPTEEWSPIEDRGAQITFSPVGNTAPVEVKAPYDPDASKRLALLERCPFVSDELVVKIGGSTSFDYIHKDRHKGTNVRKLIDHLGWNINECVYFGDGLYPGGNDEAVIGIIDTIAVNDEEETYKILRKNML